MDAVFPTLDLRLLFMCTSTRNRCTYVQFFIVFACTYMILCGITSLAWVWPKMTFIGHGWLLKLQYVRSSLHAGPDLIASPFYNYHLKL
ncbi:unnamed protein product [Coffea canephora]|uniref:Uncharacterized protein n=1 Tax=Coffea canephora TaxID=49390 RepID=A0A068TT55_COFCA|nr:unnamed protein product [Coffea canephora]